MFDHRESLGHKTVVKLIEGGLWEEAKTVCLNSQAKEKEITNKIFHTSYKMAKKNWPFNV